MTELRASPMAGAARAALVNRGALSFSSPDPCDDGPLGALVDPATSFLELRYRPSAPALAAGTLR